MVENSKTTFFMINKLTKKEGYQVLLTYCSSISIRIFVIYLRIGQRKKVDQFPIWGLCSQVSMFPVIVSPGSCLYSKVLTLLLL